MPINLGICQKCNFSELSVNLRNILVNWIFKNLNEQWKRWQTPMLGTTKCPCLSIFHTKNRLEISMGIKVGPAFAFVTSLRPKCVMVQWFNKIDETHLSHSGNLRGVPVYIMCLYSNTEPSLFHWAVEQSFSKSSKNAIFDLVVALKCYFTREYMYTLNTLNCLDMFEILLHLKDFLNSPTFLYSNQVIQHKPRWLEYSKNLQAQSQSGNVWRIWLKETS